MIYTSSFLGIPLPGAYEMEFKDLLSQLKAIDPTINTVNVNTPHVTLYYLDTQPEEKIKEISNTARTDFKILKGSRIQVKGIGFFAKACPKIIYLDIKSDQKLINFQKRQRNKLNRFYSKDKNEPFCPHLTIARIRENISPDKWENIKQEVKKIAAKINWQFAIEELFIYGVDSSKPELGQQKLEKIYS